ncbi:MAG: hypothetical protein DI598_17705, partial [Pseudopedobacter saltans]
IEVNMIRQDAHNRKQNLNIGLGIDHYTSASSDMIDLKANSSASHADTRIYPSVTWSVENEAKGSNYSLGVSSSKEFDYMSYGFNAQYAHKTKNKMGELSVGFKMYLDKVKLVTPIELRSSTQPEEHIDYGSANRNTFQQSLSYSQIINKQFLVMFMADFVEQNGYLSLPFHRVYFQDSSVHQEKLPSTRFKLPLGVRANYFLGDNFIFRLYYRYYWDNWGLKAHTADIELPIKISPFVSISPFYRFYKQWGMQYFAPYRTHTDADNFYVSNYDYANFTSHFIGTGVRISPPNGILGIRRINMMEIRFGHYFNNVTLQSNIITLNLRFK